MMRCFLKEEKKYNKISANTDVFFRKNKGFTLIELLVVIAIIGMLSSVVLVSLSSARSKSRDAGRIASAKQLQTALELYYSENGHYPISTGGCGSTVPNTAWCNSVQSLSGGHWIHDNGVSGVLDPFLSAEPIDPKQGSSPNFLPLNGGTFYYFSSGYGGSGKWYMIIFGLENSHAIENIDGARSCPYTGYPDGRLFNYGNGTNNIVTLGAGCNY